MTQVVSLADGSASEPDNDELWKSPPGTPVASGGIAAKINESLTSNSPQAPVKKVGFDINDAVAIAPGAPSGTLESASTLKDKFSGFRRRVSSIGSALRRFSFSAKSNQVNHIESSDTPLAKEEAGESFFEEDKAAVAEAALVKKLARERMLRRCYRIVILLALLGILIGGPVTFFELVMGGTTLHATNEMALSLVVENCHVWVYPMTDGGRGYTIEASYGLLDGSEFIVDNPGVVIVKRPAGSWSSCLVKLWVSSRIPLSQLAIESNSVEKEDIFFEKGVGGVPVTVDNVFVNSTNSEFVVHGIHASQLSIIQQHGSIAVSELNLYDEYSFVSVEVDTVSTYVESLRSVAVDYVHPTSDFCFGAGYSIQTVSQECDTIEEIIVSGNATSVTGTNSTATDTSPGSSSTAGTGTQTGVTGKVGSNNTVTAQASQSLGTGGVLANGTFVETIVVERTMCSGRTILCSDRFDCGELLPSVNIIILNEGSMIVNAPMASPDLLENTFDEVDNSTQLLSVGSAGPGYMAGLKLDDAGEMGLKSVPDWIAEFPTTDAMVRIDVTGPMADHESWFFVSRLPYAQMEPFWLGAFSANLLLPRFTLSDLMREHMNAVPEQILFLKSFFGDESNSVLKFAYKYDPETGYIAVPMSITNNLALTLAIVFSMALAAMVAVGGCVAIYKLLLIAAKQLDEYKKHSLRFFELKSMRQEAAYVDPAWKEKRAKERQLSSKQNPPPAVTLPHPFSVPELFLAGLMRSRANSVKEYLKSFPLLTPDQKKLPKETLQVMMCELKEDYQEYCFAHGLSERDILQETKRLRKAQIQVEVKCDQLTDVFRNVRMKTRRELMAEDRKPVIRPGEDSLSYFIRSRCVVTHFAVDFVLVKSFHQQYDSFCSLNPSLVKVSITKRAMKAHDIDYERASLRFLNPQRLNLRDTLKERSSRKDSTVDLKQTTALPQGWWWGDFLAVWSHLLMILLPPLPVMFVAVWVETSKALTVLPQEPPPIEGTDFIHRGWTLPEKFLQMELPNLLIIALALTYFLVSVMELQQYYLHHLFKDPLAPPVDGEDKKPKLPDPIPRRIIQGAVLTLVVLFMAALCGYIALVLVWAVFGAILNPSIFLPYSAACGTFVAFVTGRLSQLRKLQREFRGKVSEYMEEQMNAVMGNTVSDMKSKGFLELDGGVPSGSNLSGGALELLERTPLGGVARDLSLDANTAGALASGDVNDAVPGLAAKFAMSAPLVAGVVAMATKDKKALVKSARDMAPTVKVDPDLVEVIFLLSAKSERSNFSTALKLAVGKYAEKTKQEIDAVSVETLVSLANGQIDDRVVATIEKNLSQRAKSKIGPEAAISLIFQGASATHSKQKQIEIIAKFCIEKLELPQEILKGVVLLKNPGSLRARNVEDLELLERFCKRIGLANMLPVRLLAAMSQQDMVSLRQLIPSAAAILMKAIGGFLPPGDIQVLLGIVQGLELKTTQIAAKYGIPSDLALSVSHLGSGDTTARLLGLMSTIKTNPLSWVAGKIKMNPSVILGLLSIARHDVSDEENVKAAITDVCTRAKISTDLVPTFLNKIYLLASSDVEQVESGISSVLGHSFSKFVKLALLGRGLISPGSVTSKYLLETCKFPDVPLISKARRLSLSSEVATDKDRQRWCAELAALAKSRQIKFHRVIFSLLMMGSRYPINVMSQALKKDIGASAPDDTIEKVNTFLSISCLKDLSPANQNVLITKVAGLFNIDRKTINNILGIAILTTEEGRRDAISDLLTSLGLDDSVLASSQDFLSDVNEAVASVSEVKKGLDVFAAKIGVPKLALRFLMSGQSPDADPELRAEIVSLLSDLGLSDALLNGLVRLAEGRLDGVDDLEEQLGMDLNGGFRDILSLFTAHNTNASDPKHLRHIISVAVAILKQCSGNVQEDSIRSLQGFLGFLLHYQGHVGAPVVGNDGKQCEILPGSSEYLDCADVLSAQLGLPQSIVSLLWGLKQSDQALIKQSIGKFVADLPEQAKVFKRAIGPQEQALRLHQIINLTTGETAEAEEVANALRVDPEMLEGLCVIFSGKMNFKELLASGDAQLVMTKLGLDASNFSGLLAIAGGDVPNALEIGRSLPLGIPPPALKAIMALYSKETPKKTTILESSIAPLATTLGLRFVGPFATFVRIAQGNLTAVENAGKLLRVSGLSRDLHTVLCMLCNVRQELDVSEAANTKWRETRNAEAAANYLSSVLGLRPLDLLMLISASRRMNRGVQWVADLCFDGDVAKSKTVLNMIAQIDEEEDNDDDFDGGSRASSFVDDGATSEMGESVRDELEGEEEQLRQMHEEEDDDEGGLNENDLALLQLRSDETVLNALQAIQAHCLQHAIADVGEEFDGDFILSFMRFCNGIVDIDQIFRIFEALNIRDPERAVALVSVVIGDCNLVLEHGAQLMQDFKFVSSFHRENEHHRSLVRSLVLMGRVDQSLWDMRTPSGSSLAKAIGGDARITKAVAALAAGDVGTLGNVLEPLAVKLDLEQDTALSLFKTYFGQVQAVADISDRINLTPGIARSCASVAAFRAVKSRDFPLDEPISRVLENCLASVCDKFEVDLKFAITCLLVVQGDIESVLKLCSYVDVREPDPGSDMQTTTVTTPLGEKTFKLKDVYHALKMIVAICKNEWGTVMGGSVEFARILSFPDKSADTGFGPYSFLQSIIAIARNNWRAVPAILSFRGHGSPEISDLVILLLKLFNRNPTAIINQVDEVEEMLLAKAQIPKGVVSLLWGMYCKLPTVMSKGLEAILAGHELYSSIALPGTVECLLSLKLGKFDLDGQSGHVLEQLLTKCILMVSEEQQVEEVVLNGKLKSMGSDVSPKKEPFVRGKKLPSLADAGGEAEELASGVAEGAGVMSVDVSEATAELVNQRLGIPLQCRDPPANLNVRQAVEFLSPLLSMNVRHLLPFAHSILGIPQDLMEALLALLAEEGAGLKPRDLDPLVDTVYENLMQGGDSPAGGVGDAVPLTRDLIKDAFRLFSTGFDLDALRGFLTQLRLPKDALDDVNRLLETVTKIVEKHPDMSAVAAENVDVFVKYIVSKGEKDAPPQLISLVRAFILLGDDSDPENFQKASLNLAEAFDVPQPTVQGLIAMQKGDVEGMVDMASQFSEFDTGKVTKLQTIVKKLAPFVASKDKSESAGPDLDLKNIDPDQVFAMFDKDGTGTIDFEEFMKLCKYFNVPLGDTKGMQIFSKTDKDGSGLLDRDEFRIGLKFLQDEMSGSVLNSLGLSTPTLIKAFLAAVITLVFLFLFIFFGIAGFTTGSDFGAVINSALPISAGNGLNKDNIEEKLEKFKEKIPETVDKAQKMIANST